MNDTAVAESDVKAETAKAEVPSAPAPKPKTRAPSAPKSSNGTASPAQVPPPMQVRPPIGASLKTPSGQNLVQLNVKVDGLYVPVVQHPSMPNVHQPLGFQGVLLGIVAIPIPVAVVRLTQPTAGLNLKGELTDFSVGSFLAVPHRDSSSLQKYVPWSSTDLAGNRFTRAYEIAYLPSSSPGLFYGAELSQTDIAMLRLSPGGGALLAPGGMFAPTNAIEVATALGTLKQEDIAF